MPDLSDPKTDPAILAAAALGDTQNGVNHFACINPSLPVEVMETLIEQILANPCPGVRMGRDSVLANWNLPGYLLDRLPSGIYKFESNVALHPNTTVETLYRLMLETQNPGIERAIRMRLSDLDVVDLLGD